MVRGEFRRGIWGDGSTVHHPNNVGASDIRREDNELMRYILHRLDGMYYLSITAIIFFSPSFLESELWGAGVRHVNPGEVSLFVILAENIKTEK